MSEKYMNGAPSVAQLRQCAQLLNVGDLGALDQVSDDPRTQRVLLHALVLAAAEARMLQADANAHHHGLTAAVEAGVTTPIGLLPDPLNLLAYVSWRLKRDALLLTHISGQGLIGGDDLMLTTALAATSGSAHLLQMIHDLVCEDLQPGSSNPDATPDVSFASAIQEIQTAATQLTRLQARIADLTTDDPSIRSKRAARHRN